MPNNHQLRREYVLDHAVAAGKFGPQRRAHWSAQYDRDPAGTERVLAALASGTEDASPYPRELFPELSRPRSRRQRTVTRAAAPPPPAPAPRDNLDAQVEGWTRALFPETRPARAGVGRITRAHD